MCWMTVRHGHDALAEGLLATKRAEKTNGGHSWGYSYVDRDGNLQVHRQVGEMPDDFGNVPVVDNALVHTRLATQGNINLVNAHPFTVMDDDDNVRAVMAHNGTWHRSEDHDYFSDTWFMRNELEDFYQESGDFEEAFIETADKCGETMVALKDDKTAYCYSGRFRITRAGRVVQSSDLDTVITGRVVKITPDEAEIIRKGIRTSYKSSSSYYRGRSYKGNSTSDDSQEEEEEDDGIQQGWMGQAVVKGKDVWDAFSREAPGKQSTLREQPEE